MLILQGHFKAKWPEIVEMRNTTVATSIATMRSLFPRMVLPEQLISENGSQLTSGEFKYFTEMNGIRYVTGPLCHPPKKGLVEHTIQSSKNAVKADRTNRSMQHKLDRFLLNHRTVPHATIGHSPAQLLFGRNRKSRLDLLKLNVKRVADSQLL